MIRLIVCDFDGTILDQQTQTIYPRVAQAIRQAQQAGIDFCAATGRNAPAARKILRQAQISSWLIDLNGAELRNAEDHCLRQQTLSLPQVEQILDLCQDSGLLITVYAGESKIIFRDLQEHYEQYIGIEGSGKNTANYPMARFLSEVQQRQRPDQIEEPIFKVEIRGNDLAALAAVRRTLSSLTTVELTSAFARNLEVLPRQCNKAAALEQLRERLQLDRCQIAVFGDDLNDRCLFELYPCSYAVDNARPEIKALASRIIPSCQKQGPAEVIAALSHQ